MSERTDMQRPCLDLLESLRQHGAPIVATRTNTGLVKTIKGNWVQLCRDGWPDITACIEGRFVGIETKRSKNDRQRKTQEDAQEMIETAGGIYLLVNELGVLREYLNLK